MSESIQYVFVGASPQSPTPQSPPTGNADIQSPNNAASVIGLKSLVQAIAPRPLPRMPSLRQAPQPVVVTDESSICFFSESKPDAVGEEIQNLILKAASSVGTEIESPQTTPRKASFRRPVMQQDHVPDAINSLAANAFLEHTASRNGARAHPTLRRPSLSLSPTSSAQMQ